MTRVRLGRSGWGGWLLLCTLVAVLQVGEATMARAQESQADSTATGPENPFGDPPNAAAGDSAAVHPGAGQAPAGVPAASDSAKVEALLVALADQPGFKWLGFLGQSENQRPSMTGTVNSDRARYGLEFDVDVPLSALGGFNSRTTYHRDRFKEPALEQEKANSAFSTRWDRTMSSWGNFDIDFNHRENTTEGERANSKAVDSAITSSLRGRGVLGNSGVDGKWSLKGSITDKKVESGLTAGATSQQLSRGTVSTGLGRDFGSWAVSVSAGMDAAAGPQLLSASTDGSDAQEDTKTTLSDTLGVNLRWQGGANRRFTAKLTRQALTEERLDYLKDTRGVTLVDPDTRLKVVGNEREVRNVIRVDLNAEDRLTRSIRYNLRFGIESKETQWDLNQQNFVPEESQTLGGDMWYRYAAAGSLKVSVSFIERSDDRLLQGDVNFRGKHFNKSGQVSMTLDQRIWSSSNLRLAYGEDLTQQIYEYKLATGTQDIDVLNRNLEAKLSSKPWDSLNFTALGSYRSTENVSLDATQVARNNRIQDSWKVTMDYKLDLTPMVSFGQGYQLSIDYTDYEYSMFEQASQRDKYYKRTQLKSELSFRFPGEAVLSINHVIDRTRGGTKPVEDMTESPIYLIDPSRRQDENRLHAQMTVPIFGYRLEVGTNRNVRLAGTSAAEEFYGDLRIGLAGESRFLNEHLVLGLKFGHVWAYGPPRLIRTERDQAYFTSATHLTWIF